MFSIELPLIDCHVIDLFIIFKNILILKLFSKKILLEFTPFEEVHV